MNIQTSAFRSTSILAAATAVFWVGSAAAAPLAPSYPSNSAALFASVMQEPEAQDSTQDGTADIAADLQRQVVNYPTTAMTGTIVIDTAQTYLYFVLGDGKAIRYGIGVGRDGFTWSVAVGDAHGRMAGLDAAAGDDRAPALPAALDGRRQRQPLGARAIYLGSTVYRIHGTNAPETIGTRVSAAASVSPTPMSPICTAA